MVMLGAHRQEKELRLYQEKIDIPTLFKMRARWSRRRWAERGLHSHDSD